MSFWSPSQAGSPDEPEVERVPVPRVGEVVRLQVSDGLHVGVYHARVRALGLRRIFLESAETGSAAEHKSLEAEEDISQVPALPTRTPLTLSYVRRDSLYQCETRVVGPAKAGTLTVARPHLVTRLQRRQFYRLPLQAPTTFRVQGETTRTPPIPARLVNLSGGGALLAASKPVLGGLRVAVRVPTGKQGEPREIEAEALDCRVATQGLARIYLVRLRFLGPPLLAEEDRDEIVAYIFEQQRLLLRTRKLLRA